MPEILISLQHESCGYDSFLACFAACYLWVPQRMPQRAMAAIRCGQALAAHNLSTRQLRLLERLRFLDCECSLCWGL